MHRSIGTLLRSGFLSVAMVLASGLAFAQVEGVKLQSPQPDAEDLKPGLAVDYYFHHFRNIDELVDWEGYKEGQPGPPIERLNFRSGKGDVLTSENDDAVGAKITGLILLDKPGLYSFAFESNDGVRLEIDDKLIIEDPDVHGDRFSDIGQVVIEEAGWYPITIRYFERKNTATLRFHWLPPEAEGTMPLVPAKVLAHQSE
jgi:hypothetical protein